MLTHLHIKNFTIIDNLNIEFSPGLTVLTGETGAGKSIIIDTVELALGGRADLKAIRNGCNNCEIVATISIENNQSAKQWLQNHELDSDECIVRRSINSDGRSRNTINGIQFPLQLVRELGELILQIHGQHGQQALLGKNTQLNLLDNFATHKKLTAQVCQLFTTWQHLTKKLHELQEITKNKTANKDLLTYQITELNELNITNHEFEHLQNEHKKLANAEQIANNCQFTLNLLNESSITKAQSQIQNLINLDPQLKTIDELLENANIHINEANLELNHYLNSIEINPERLQQIEKKLNDIHDISRKHRIEPEELPNLQKDLEKKLTQLEEIEKQQSDLVCEISKIENEYKKLSLTLSESRKKAATKLSKEIEKQMNLLNMPDGKFSINFITNTELFSCNGFDQIEFMVSTNLGQPLMPLSKVASGGELSRLSLAIQVITAQKHNIPILVFDEVDTGIGGKTAQIVGQLLKKLGTKAQVLCVTHLPQIAAIAHNHLQVTKESTSNDTITSINPLTGSSKIDEIARMLGGIKITPQTLAHAKEMCEETGAPDWS